jgi:hypothetical protein
MCDVTVACTDNRGDYALRRHNMHGMRSYATTCVNTVQTVLASRSRCFIAVLAQALIHTCVLYGISTAQPALSAQKL